MDHFRPTLDEQLEEGPRIRWVKRGTQLVLQERIQILTRIGIGWIENQYEWRDVPEVSDD